MRLATVVPLAAVVLGIVIKVMSPPLRVVTESIKFTWPQIGLLFVAVKDEVWAIPVIRFYDSNVIGLKSSVIAQGKSQVHNPFRT